MLKKFLALLGLISYEEAVDEVVGYIDFEVYEIGAEEGERWNWFTETYRYSDIEPFRHWFTDNDNETTLLYKIADHRMRCIALEGDTFTEKDDGRSGFLPPHRIERIITNIRTPQQ